MACRHRRIVVIGATGSGKSTFAHRLARSLDVAFMELDALFWGSDWTPAPPDVFRARADEATRATAWVGAGNYHHVRDIVWPRAEAIVWLDYSLPLVFWRLTVRTVRRAVTREVLSTRVPTPVRPARALAHRDHPLPRAPRSRALAPIRSRL